MDIRQPTINQLFDQLGLPSTDHDIDRFVAAKQSNARGWKLHEAPIWTSSQRGFLCEAVGNDSEWSAPAESLASRLGCHLKIA